MSKHYFVNSLLCEFLLQIDSGIVWNILKRNHNIIRFCKTLSKLPQIICNTLSLLQDDNHRKQMAFISANSYVISNEPHFHICLRTRWN